MSTGAPSSSPRRVAGSSDVMSQPAPAEDVAQRAFGHRRSRLLADRVGFGEAAEQQGGAPAGWPGAPRRCNYVCRRHRGYGTGRCRSRCRMRRCSRRAWWSRATANFTSTPASFARCSAVFRAVGEMSNPVTG